MNVQIELTQTHLFAIASVAGAVIYLLAGAATAGFVRGHVLSDGVLRKIEEGTDPPWDICSGMFWPLFWVVSLLAVFVMYGLVKPGKYVVAIPLKYSVGYPMRWLYNKTSGEDKV